MKMKQAFKLSALSAALLVGSFPAYSGQISGVDQASPSVATGFGAWNLDNVNVKIVNVDTGEELDPLKVFYENDGSYDAMTYGDTFVSEVMDSVDGTVMGNLHGKDWPVGEPSGVKAITVADRTAVLTNSKPASCIMSTSYFKYSDDPKYSGATPDDGWLDSATPNPTVCDSPFQTHKRFKVDALPSTVDGSANEGIDLVFNVEDEDAGATSRRYMVLQKLNNYTDSRLSGFKIEVGFGVGNDFVAGDAGGNLKLSIGIGENDDPDTPEVETDNIWDAEDLAPFSAGLFGKADEGDDPKHPHDGFFSNQRAYFPVEMPNDYTIQSGEAVPPATSSLTTNYTDVFGDWLPSIWEPTAIFWDDTPEDPLDDEIVVAFWGENPSNVGEYTWLTGYSDDGDTTNDFAPISLLELSEKYGADNLSTGTIEDVLNVGLSYIVEIGNVTTDVADVKDFTDDSTFTIRLTPLKSDNQDVPGYMVEGNTAPEEVIFPVPETENETTSSGGGSASFISQFGFIAMLLAFLGLGGWIVRNKMSK